MKRKDGMVGFWAMISIAVMAVGCILSMTYFNPSKSLSGLLVTLVIMIFWLAVANLIINFIYIYKDEKNSMEENTPGITASSEAMNVKDVLDAEFRKLVTAIAWHNAKSGEDLHLLVRKEGETEEKILICPEDMEKAFLEAAKMVSEKCVLDRCPCKTNCDNQTVLQKIRNLRKNFEKIPQTP